jgi:hypothetical protein
MFGNITLSHEHILQRAIFFYSQNNTPDQDDLQIASPKKNIS